MKFLTIALLMASFQAQACITHDPAPFIYVPNKSLEEQLANLKDRCVGRQFVQIDLKTGRRLKEPFYNMVSLETFSHLDFHNSRITVTQLEEVLKVCNNIDVLNLVDTGVDQNVVGLATLLNTYGKSIRRVYLSGVVTEELKIALGTANALDAAVEQVASAPNLPSTQPELNFKSQGEVLALYRLQAREFRSKRAINASLIYDKLCSPYELVSPREILPEEVASEMHRLNVNVGEALRRPEVEVSPISKRARHTRFDFDEAISPEPLSSDSEDQPDDVQS